MIGKSISCTLMWRSVEKTGPDTAEVGDTITYTITVYNTGDVDLYITSLVDSILGDLTDYISDGVVTLAEGFESFRVDFDVLLPGDDPIENSVRVVGWNRFDCDEVSHSDDHSVDVLRTGVSIIKEGPLTATVGDTITYTITVTNVGEVDLFIEVLEDSLFGDLLGHIPGEVIRVGEVIVITLVYTVPVPGSDTTILNTVIIEGHNQYCSDPVRASDEHSVNVAWTWLTGTCNNRNPVTDFRIVFTPDMDDGRICYEITSTNPGAFYFNMLYHVNSIDQTMNYRLPEGFETKGATPFHAYIWDDLDGDGEIDYWDELTDISDRIVDTTASTIEIEGVEPSNNVLITIYITFSLKGTTGYDFDAASAFEGVEYGFTAGIYDIRSESLLVAHVNVREITSPCVFGTVLDQTNEDCPVAGVTFNLYSSDGRLVISFTTDEYGFFIFSDLWIDKYMLEIELPMKILLHGNGDSNVVISVSMQINLQPDDYIQVNVDIKEDSSSEESTSTATTSLTYLGTDIPTVSEPFGDNGEPDLGDTLEPEITGYALSLPVGVALLICCISIASLFTARKIRKKDVSTLYHISEWDVGFECTFKGTEEELEWSFNRSEPSLGPDWEKRFEWIRDCSRQLSFNLFMDKDDENPSK
ncbi:MAG: hypothetical protein ACXAB9_00610 [Candidatus Thorarchaeota archaeon]